MKIKKSKNKVKKYENSYASVLHHILDMHESGKFTNNQYYYAMDQVKSIIKELANYEN